MVSGSFHKKIVLKCKHLSTSTTEQHNIFSSPEQSNFFFLYKVETIDFVMSPRAQISGDYKPAYYWRVLVIASHKHSNSIGRLRHLPYVKDSMNTTGALLKWTGVFPFPIPHDTLSHCHLLKTQNQSKKIFLFFLLCC